MFPLCFPLSSSLLPHELVARSHCRAPNPWRRRPFAPNRTFSRAISGLGGRHSAAPRGASRLVRRGGRAAECGRRRRRHQR
eukprot:1911119-Pleurochrysis_carterae.AAC.1